MKQRFCSKKECTIMHNIQKYLMALSVAISVFFYPVQAQESLGEKITNFFRGVVKEASGTPGVLTAYRAYVQTHSSIAIFDFMSALANYGNVLLGGDDSAYVLRPICYSEVGTFPVNITVSKGLQLQTAIIQATRVTYEGWAIQLRVTFVMSSHFGGLSSSLQSAILTDGEVKRARKWKVNDEWRTYSDHDQEAVFFQKNIMVYYLKRSDGGYEYYDSDFFTSGIVKP